MSQGTPLVQKSAILVLHDRMAQAGLMIGESRLVVPCDAVEPRTIVIVPESSAVVRDPGVICRQRDLELAVVEKLPTEREQDRHEPPRNRMERGS